MAEKRSVAGMKRIKYTWSDGVPLIIVIVGLIMLLAAEKFPELSWIGIDWSRFLVEFWIVRGCSGCVAMALRQTDEA